MCSEDENKRISKTNRFSTIGHDEQSETSRILKSFIVIKICKVKLIKEVPYNSTTI